jgi:hypothetical protein
MRKIVRIIRAYPKICGMILKLQFGEILRHAAMDKMAKPNRKMANGYKQLNLLRRESVGGGLDKNPNQHIAGSSGRIDKVCGSKVWRVKKMSNSCPNTPAPSTKLLQNCVGVSAVRAHNVG